MLVYEKTRQHFFVSCFLNTYRQASDSSASSTQFPQMELVRVDIYLHWWVVVIHDTCSYWTIEMSSQFVFAPSLIQFVELLDDSRRLKTRSFSHYVSSVSSLTTVGEPSFKPPNLRSDCWSCSMVTRWKFTHIYIYIDIHIYELAQNSWGWTTPDCMNGSPWLSTDDVVGIPDHQ